MPESLSVLFQYLLPKRLLTHLAGKLASWRGGALTTAVISAFARRYGVDMSEAAEPDLRAYACFNDFFTRALHPGQRPLADADLVCPVDGAISEFGAIADGQIFQAKGHHYSTLALVGGDTGLAARFENGSFATLYLSPRDYHRIHMPCAGRLSRMIHVPGSLFSVDRTMTRRVPGLFARNERVVCVFESAAGPFALVLVGAALVGSVATVWHGVVTPPRHRRQSIWQYEETGVELAQGAEMGRFLLGSTVVAIFARPALRFAPEWMPGRPVRMGEAMGSPGTA
ncbi:MAG: archaetidylserine decarboxylase [Azoarcus sp.]|jgi:phosphatidylserine decarboxylase|nr:archaetidylserine decarboxylase [Azoarcus sp.]